VQPPYILAASVSVDTTRWEHWRVTFHWHRVQGRMVPVGIDVRSFSTVDPFGPVYALGDDPDQPTEVLRDTLRRLPFGRLLRESRARVAVRFELQAATLSAFGAEVTANELAGWDTDAATEDATSPADENYRLTASIFRRYDGTDPRAAASRTWEELERLGVTDRRGQPVKRALVRRWIAEARRRGYLPPADSSPVGDTS